MPLHKFTRNHVFPLAATCSLLGVKHVVMSPGSRSAPLVFAFARNKRFRLHIVPDERSAGYVALGIAQQTNDPVVVFCTSGTAAANYLPAVTEAFYQRLPLVLITADRPEDLLNQQDGQMINQQNLFGSHVRFFCQLGSSTPGDVIRGTAEAIGKARALRGPVHINKPFSEPLYPERIDSGAYSRAETAARLWMGKNPDRHSPAEASPNLYPLEEAWVNCSRRLILIGQATLNEKWITPLLELQARGDAVILADVVSNAHPFGSAPHADLLVSAAGEKRLAGLEPELLISFGGPVLSKGLKNWLKSRKPLYHFRIQQEPEKIDTYGNLTHTVYADPALVLEHLAGIRWNQRSENEFVTRWKETDLLTGKKIDSFLADNTWSELHVTARVLQHLPEACNLQLANSSVVRYVSFTGRYKPSWIINGNRGTSGIDGCTSTAVGAAKANLRPTVLLTGDLAFLYDRNGLWMNEVPGNLRIVVFNNRGGGIFTLIDGPSKHKAYEPFFTTPVPQQVKLTAQQSGLDYYFCDNMASLGKTLNRFMDPGRDQAAVLELAFDMKENAGVFRRFKNITI